MGQGPDMILQSSLRIRYYKHYPPWLSANAPKSPNGMTGNSVSVNTIINAADKTNHRHPTGHAVTLLKPTRHVVNVCNLCSLQTKLTLLIVCTVR